MNIIKCQRLGKTDSSRTLVWDGFMEGLEFEDEFHIEKKMDTQMRATGEL